MIFILLRIAVFGICFVFCFFLEKRFTSISLKKTVLFALLISAGITTVSALFPTENAFVSFPSPQAAYQYHNFGEIQQILSGQRSDLIVAQNGDKNIHAICPKTPDGWKIGCAFDLKMVKSLIFDEAPLRFIDIKIRMIIMLWCLETTPFCFLLVTAMIRVLYV